MLYTPDDRTRLASDLSELLNVLQEDLVPSAWVDPDDLETEIREMMTSITATLKRDVVQPPEQTELVAAMIWLEHQFETLVRLRPAIEPKIRCVVVDYEPGTPPDTRPNLPIRVYPYLWGNTHRFIDSKDAYHVREPSAEELDERIHGFWSEERKAHRLRMDPVIDKLGMLYGRLVAMWPGAHKPPTADAAHAGWFTVTEAAQLLGHNPGWVTRLCNRKHLVCEGSGRSRKINPQSLAEYKAKKQKDDQKGPAQ